LERGDQNLVLELFGIAHICNPSYLGGSCLLLEAIGRIYFKVNPRQKVLRALISTNKKLGIVAHACHPSYLESINRRIMV
jgi:hypothetical protein